MGCPHGYDLIVLCSVCSSIYGLGRGAVKLKEEEIKNKKNEEKDGSCDASSKED